MKQDFLSLKNKIAVISGAAEGIGFATAKLFTEHGATVVLLDIQDDLGKKAEKILKEEGARVLYVHCDVTRANHCKRAMETVETNFGRLDILVNNAGVTIRKTVVDLLEKEWDFVIDVGLKGTFLLSKYAIPLMRKTGGGSIINTGSGWGLKGGDKAAAYCAAKGGIVNLTRAMAIDHGSENIRVNSINPGDTATNMLASEGEQLGFDDREDFFKDSAKGRPLERIGLPLDVAKGMLFLASDLSSWVTGTALVVDGGGIA